MGETRSAQVDVICCVFNPGPDLDSTIDSVLSQTYKNLRLVIVDDGSNCGLVRERLEGYAQTDSRVELVLNAENRGLTYNLVEQVKLSRAEYIGRIDSGDTWHSDKLDKQVKTLNREEDLVVVGTQCRYVEMLGGEVGSSWFAESHEEIMNSIDFQVGIFEHSSILFRRVINYRSEFKMSQDLDLYLRAKRIGKLCCLPEYLTTCRINSSGLTIKKRYIQRKYQQLAYKSSRAVEKDGCDVNLQVKSNYFESWLWARAEPFYLSYVIARTNNRPVVYWIFSLMITLIIYPPLITDYMLKLKTVFFKLR